MTPCTKNIKDCPFAQSVKTSYGRLSCAYCERAFMVTRASTIDKTKEKERTNNGT
jgi:hypothetical protein